MKICSSILSAALPRFLLTSFPGATSKAATKAKLLLFSVGVLPSLAFGALSPSTVWEVRPSGADTNGGGFVSGASGNDYSVQDAAQFSGTDLASTNGTNAWPTVTSATHNFVSTDVGNIIQITAGTSWTTGFYQIVSVSSNAATLDRVCGSSASLSGGTWAEGGALASIGKCGSGFVSGNILYINNAGATVYSITSATNSVSNGCFNPSAAVSGSIVGYATNRTVTNSDTPPTIQLNVGTATIFGANCYALIQNLTLDGNNQITSRCTFAIQSALQNCTVENFTGPYAISGLAYRCKLTGNSSTSLFGTQARAFYCEAYANTKTPFNAAVYLVAVNCVSYNNTGATTDGFSPGQSSYFQNCVAYGNGRYGFNATNGPAAIVNCVSENNTTAAFNQGGNTSPVSLFNFAYDNGFTLTSNDYSTGVIHYTNGSVFNNPAGNDFSLNNIAGRGALLRAAGFATFPAGVMVGYPDIGAVQSGSPGPTPTPTPNPTIQVTVQTNPAGRAFSVDGTDYGAAQIFSWATGSTHTIATTSPQSGDPGVRYYFSSWSDTGAISHTVAPTTNTTYTAKFGTQYYLTMNAGLGGTVSLPSSWRTSGSTVSISATPSNNYSFTNWNGAGTGSYSGANNPASITMNGPITETATFTHN